MERWLYLFWMSCFHACFYLNFLFRDFLLTCHENRHLKGKTFEDFSDHSGTRKSQHFRRNTIFPDTSLKDPLGGGEWTKRFMPKIFGKKTS